ncbi:carboxymuconolactone decarboxylase family protein [Haladaptatus halobius]|uniref:carboxymuconolactone decarboxylase family protein n=1 Tax=Haladaptatus halobius TaxID=2884875 RepID=UPI001D0BDC2F|nr:carboxymuconolactone decarboxylase family protein [Haladaptatus halobius]
MSFSDNELTERQEEIKERFKEERNYWSSLYGDLLCLDPEYLDKYRELSAQPWKHGELDPKVKEFIYIAIDCSTTHLYNKGTRVHINNAFDQGATVDEIMEVFQLASVLGVHSVTEGVPILVDEAGQPDAATGEAAEEEERLRQKFEDERGYWSELWEDVLKLDHGYFEAYLDFSAHPWNEGELDPKTKELIYVAIDVATTHLYLPGLRVHIQNALSYGATREEIMEVFELASVLGIHTITDSVPILVEEAQKRGELPEEL